MCECKNLVESYYKTYKICKDCGNIFIKDRLVGDIASSLKQDMYDICNCGSVMLIISEFKKDKELISICPKCSRLKITNMLAMTQFQIPPIMDKSFQDEESINNSGFVLDEKETKIIGAANYFETIPLNKAISDIPGFLDSIEKGYVTFKEDYFGTVIDVIYNPINPITGEINYIKQENVQEIILDPYFYQLWARIYGHFLENKYKNYDISEDTRNTILAKLSKFYNRE